MKILHELFLILDIGSGFSVDNSTNTDYLLYIYR